MKKLFCSLIILLSLISYAHAMDTDLYVLSSVDVPPNVLIILDNSGSMNNEISGANYDNAYQYPSVFTESPNAVYYKTKQGWKFWRSDYNVVTCNAARTSLQAQGNYRGKVNLTSSACGGNNQEFSTGNYINYLYATGGPGNQPRFGLAKAIVHSYVNTTDNVRFGVMVFNTQNGGRLLYPISDTWLSEHKTGIYNAMAGLQADTWTPLAETLYEAGLYFQGQDSYFNPGVKYNKPVQYYCQKNYVILITDGEPTKDVLDLAEPNPIKNGIGDYDGDGKEQTVFYENQGSHYLDDVAMYLRDIDLSPEITTKPHKQNITTYTVGFTIDSPLLDSTAKNGGGKYFYAHNAQSFVIALQTIIADILEKSRSYVAPVVPISQLESTSAGNRMYLAMFKPTFKSFWKGNIKKFGISTSNSGEVKIGDILDMNGALVMDSDNRIKDSATSYWSSEPDGGDVEKGGVGELLLKRTTARSIYTDLGTSTTLTDSSNAFTVANTSVTPSKLGLATNDNAGRDKVINFIHGLDSYDENGNGITNEKRDWVLGAFIHSRPFVVHYGSQSVIYAGANDGMLHAFDDQTGAELWAFIPSSLLPGLKELNGESLQFFVDGAPKGYIKRDGSNNITQAILIFGLRRGGNRYIALDVTNPLLPKWMWEISPSTAGFQEMGQTWSAPQIGRIQYGTGEKWVAFIAGGYDTNQDNLPLTANDTVGRAVYVVDIQNGSLIWSYSYAQNPLMKYSVPSDIARVDTDGNGKIDRLYVGDIGGQIWRFDVGDPDPARWTAKVVFDCNKGESLKKKIFYPPDVTLERGNYEMVLFGSGDREHPKDTTKINRLYAVKDKNPATVLSETDLVNVTTDQLQDPNYADKETLLNLLETKSGWYITLDKSLGEKSVSQPVVFYGVVYYTTFTPKGGTGTDICYLGEGTGKVYALAYTTGNAVFNLDGSLDGTISQSDRSKIIGAAIPSGVIITFISGTSMGYAGVGEGVYRPPVATNRSLVPVNWRIVF